MIISFFGGKGTNRFYKNNTFFKFFNIFQKRAFFFCTFKI